MLRRLQSTILLAATIIVVFLTANATMAQTGSKTNYFPYPTAPDTMNNFYDRTDYIITHFWDRCDMKTAFSARQRMSEALRDYLELMPYATRRPAHKSVAALIKSLEKQPKDLVFMADEAEKYLYGDSAIYVSEELFLPFARGVADNKKVNKADRERYARKAQILLRSMIGSPTPYIDYTDRNGNAGNLSQIPDSTSLTLVIIDTPDCFDCRLSRTRLNANINITRLIDSGVLKIVSLSPVEATDEWRASVTSYPEAWTVAASPVVTDFIDLRSEPYYLLLDQQGLIRIKTGQVEEILNLIGG